MARRLMLRVGAAAALLSLCGMSAPAPAQDSHRVFVIDISGAIGVATAPETARSSRNKPTEPDA